MFETFVLPTDPWFYVTGYIAVGLIAITKSAFGGGIAMVGIPVMALAMPPLEAAIILGPTFFIMDVFAVHAFRNVPWSKPDVFILWPGFLLGIAIGTIFFISINPLIVTSTIGIVTLIHCAHWFLKGRQREFSGMTVKPVLALTAGTASGFASFIAHGGGPPVIAYLLRRGLDKSVYAGTLIMFFIFGNFFKAIPFTYIALGIPGLIWKILVLTPIIPFAVWLGKFLHDRLSQERLYFWCYIMLTAAALKLTVDTLFKILS